MKNGRNIVTGCVIALVFGGVAMAQDAGPGPNGPGQGGGAMQIENEAMRTGMVLERIINEPELAEKAGITAEQIKTLNAAMSGIKKEQIKLKAEMELASVEQVDLMAQSTLDEKQILGTVEKIGEIKTKLAKIAVSQLLLVKKTLTPEQIKKIKGIARDMHKQRAAEWKEKKKEERKDTAKDETKDQQGETEKK